MSNKLSLFLLSIFIPSFLLGQITTKGSRLTNPQSRYTAETVIKTLDGGFAICGSAVTIASSSTPWYVDQDPWLTKLDSTGYPVWNFIYRDTADTDEDVLDMVQTDNGGFLMVGNDRMRLFGPVVYRIFMIKVDANGNLEWQITDTSSTSSIAQGVVALGSDEYAIYGTTDDHAFIKKIDGAGNTLADRVFSTGVYETEIHEMSTTSDGGLILTGHSDAKTLLAKLDASLNEVWMKTADLTGSSVEEGLNCLETMAGDYLFRLEGGNSQVFITTDISGNVMDSVQIDGLYTIPEMQRMRELSDGTFLVVGGETEGVTLHYDPVAKTAVGRIHPNVVFTDVSEGINGAQMVVGDNTPGVMVYNLDRTGYNSCSENIFLTTLKPANVNSANVTAINQTAPIFGFSGLFSDSTASVSSILVCADEVTSNDYARPTYQKIGDANVIYGDGSTADTDISALFLSSEGGPMVIGNMEAFGAGGDDAYVVKLDHLGEKEWIYTYGGSGEDVLHAGVTTSDGGTVLVGQSQCDSCSSDPLFVMKLNASGIILWQKNFDNIGLYTQGWKIIQTSNGDLVVAGRLIGATNSDLFVTRLNSSGGMKWAKYYPLSQGEVAKSVIETLDGGLLLTSNTNKYSLPNSDAWLVKTDEDGNVLWTKNYNGSTNANMIRSVQLNDSSIVTLGYTSSGFGVYSLVLIKTTRHGDLIWYKSIHPEHVNERLIPWTLELDNNNNLLLGGRIWNSTDDYSYLFAIKTDTSGIPFMSNRYGDGTFEGGYVVNDPLDNGYYVAGSAESFDANDLILFKADANGYTGDCYQDTVLVTTSVRSSVATAQTLSATSLSATEVTTTIGRTATTNNLISIDLRLSLSSTDVSCFGFNDGTATMAESNGFAPYVYFWDPNISGETISSLSPGVYVANVLDDNGCMVTDSIEIFEPATVSSVITASDVSCYSGSDGMAYVTPSGGTAPYTYFWSNGILTDTISGLLPGNYSVNVFDDNNCLSSSIVSISEPDPLTHTLTGTDNTCFGGANGTATATASNGTPPYSYSWSDGGSGSNRTGLAAGTYSVIISDSCGASITDSLVISEPDSMVVTLVVSDVSCNGGTNGSVSTNIAGGTGPFTYLWHKDGSTGSSLSGQVAGTDSVTVTDACGQTITLTYVIGEPALFSVSITTTDATCYNFGDGSATANVSGGTAPYIYLWNTGHNTSMVSGLFDGSYSVSVTDSNGCFASNFAFVNEPDELLMSFDVVDATCNGADGEIIAMTSGGTMPYNYSWIGSASLTDTVTNATEGVYTLNLTDNNGCISIDSVVVGTRVDPVELCVVTVDSLNRNVLSWAKASAGNVNGYKIYRNIAGTYTQVGYRDQDSLSYYIDTDFGVDPGVTSYRYKISVLDTCGNESDLSDFHETIHLTSNVGVGGEVNLIWDNYEGFAFGFYYILRDSTFSNTWQIIDSVSFTNFTYTDFSVPSIGAVYAIQVATPALCDATKGIGDFNSSRSNSAQNIKGPSSIEDLKESSKIYPNPVKDQLTIELSSATIQEVQLFDMQGRLVRSEVVNGYRTQLTVDDLRTGMYLLRVITEHGSFEERITKTW